MSTHNNGSKLLNIGFGNVVMASRIVAVVTPTSAPMKRLREEARVAGKLVPASDWALSHAMYATVPRGRGNSRSRIKNSTTRAGFTPCWGKRARHSRTGERCSRPPATA